MAASISFDVFLLFSFHNTVWVFNVYVMILVMSLKPLDYRTRPIHSFEFSMLRDGQDNGRLIACMGVISTVCVLDFVLIYGGLDQIRSLLCVRVQISKLCDLRKNVTIILVGVGASDGSEAIVCFFFVIGGIS